MATIISNNDHHGNSDGAPEPQTFWVSPAKPLKGQTIALPAGDQIGIAVVEPLVCCFMATDKYEERAFIDAVVAATARCTAEMPILAGRTEWAGQPGGRLHSVIPDDAKVAVRIAWLPHVDGRKLDAGHWAPHEIDISEVSLWETIKPGIGSVNFGIQANICANGGIMICIHMNHIVLDGSSQALLQLLFAHHLARATDGKPYRPSGMLPPEALDKSTVKGSHPAKPILEWKDWKRAPVNSRTPEENTAIFLEKMSRLCGIIWHISAEKMNQLRSSMQTPNGPKLSANTCITLWLWRSFCKARQLPLDTITRSLVPVQTRGRVEGLHPNYSGSALVHARVKASVGELLNASPTELGKRIERSVAWWTAPRIRELWGSIEDTPDIIPNYTSNIDREFGPDVEISSNAQSPYYKVPWGKMVTVRAWRIPGVAFTDGWVCITPRLPNGGQEFMTFMTREDASRMMRDPEFRAYADFWCSTDPDQEAEAAAAQPLKARL